APMVALAVPWPHSLRAAFAARLAPGTILIDCTNPEREDGRSLEIGHSTSGAEELVRVVPHVRVVKAFNALYAEILRGDVRFEATPSVLYCGDDAAAREAVRDLIARCGFD